LIYVQGSFDNNNNFICKEIGIVFEKDPKLNHNFLIEPPYDFTLLNTKSRKTAIWLTNTHHNIYWNDKTTTVFIIKSTTEAIIKTFPHFDDVYSSMISH